jgi:hypothetical protein
VAENHSVFEPSPYVGVARRHCLYIRIKNKIRINNI